MIFSQNLYFLTLMFALLAAPAIKSSEQKENVKINEPFGIPEKIKKKQVGKWENSKVRLLRSGKQLSVVINAKRTNYELIDGIRQIQCVGIQHEMRYAQLVNHLKTPGRVYWIAT